MKEEPTQKPSGKIARSLPENCPQNCPQRAKLTWEGRPVPMVLESRGWRARKRSKSLNVDVTAPTTDLAQAKKIIKAELERRKNEPEKKPEGQGTLLQVVKVYRATPKRVSDSVAEDNIKRLKAIVAKTWGKDLPAVPVAELPKLWPAYVAMRQGRQVPDYNTRRPENTAINSAMRAARSIFIPKLRPAYSAAGIALPDDAANVIWPAELVLQRSETADSEMVAAWRALPVGSPLWWVVGLARFAGMRRSEILAMRGKWAAARGNGIVIELRDRPEDKYWSKTGRPYSAVVMDPELATALQAVEKEAMVLTHPDAARWIEREPQDWLRPFVGGARLPLHRLRGLYADHVRREMEDAILARQQAKKVASEAVGHTSVATTEAHYFSGD